MSEEIIYYKITFFSDIDFFDEKIKIYIKIPKHYIKEKQLSMQNTEDNDINIYKENHLIINEKFKISEDYKKVFVSNYKYDIPDFFKRELVENNDKKVWEMIFYHIFASEISKNVMKFKKIFGEKV